MNIKPDSDITVYFGTKVKMLVCYLVVSFRPSKTTEPVFFIVVFHSNMDLVDSKVSYSDR